jgi:hypothetical protein
VYRCPAMGLNVQGFAGNNQALAPSEDIYEAMTCTACGRIHLVNPTTGHVAGSNAKSSLDQGGGKRLTGVNYHDVLLRKNISPAVAK